jgi:glycosyltransferase involved in cell wall biosynthesis
MGFKRSAVHRIAYRLCAPFYDQVHAVSEEVRRRHIREDRLDPKKTITVYNGVDEEAIDSYGPARPAEFGCADNSLVVISVANIRRIKGLDVLVRTAAIVCRDLPEARFVVAGSIHDEKYFQSVLKLAQELKVSDKINFIGCSNEVPALLKASHVFFLPSRSEGMSNALLEAMACALPCVATAVGGNSELIRDGDNGYVVPSEDPDLAAQRIVTLLRDSGLATRMGQAGRMMVQTRFTVQLMMDRIVGLYDELLNAEIRHRDAGNGILASME